MEGERERDKVKSGCVNIKGCQSDQRPETIEREQAFNFCCPQFIYFSRFLSIFLSIFLSHPCCQKMNMASPFFLYFSGLMLLLALGCTPQVDAGRCLKVGQSCGYFYACCPGLVCRSIDSSIDKNECQVSEDGRRRRRHRERRRHMPSRA